VNRAEREASYVDFVSARREHFRRIAYALCGDWHRADDLLQQALVKL
jgi:DNA-directed RNA polymerase specialized sigma24 family protein